MTGYTEALEGAILDIAETALDTDTVTGAIHDQVKWLYDNTGRVETRQQASDLLRHFDLDRL